MRKKKGVSLIEVIVASMLLAMTIGTFLMSYVARRDIITVNKQRVIAQSILEREFEKIRRMSTKSQIQKYLYHSDDPTIPISSENPFDVSIDNTIYKLSYLLDEANGTPYTLVSLGDDDNNLLMADSKGAKVIEVEASITWNDYMSNSHNITTIFRGQDAGE